MLSTLLKDKDNLNLHLITNLNHCLKNCGSSEVSISTEKLTYEPGENVIFFVLINNQKCKMNLISIKIFIIENLIYSKLN